MQRYVGPQPSVDSSAPGAGTWFPTSSTPFSSNKGASPVSTASARASSARSASAASAFGATGSASRAGRIRRALLALLKCSCSSASEISRLTRRSPRAVYSRGIPLRSMMEGLSTRCAPITTNTAVRRAARRGTIAGLALRRRRSSAIAGRGQPRLSSPASPRAFAPVKPQAMRRSSSGCGRMPASLAWHPAPRRGAGNNERRARP